MSGGYAVVQLPGSGFGIYQGKILCSWSGTPKGMELATEYAKDQARMNPQHTYLVVSAGKSYSMKTVPPDLPPPPPPKYELVERDYP